MGVVNENDLGTDLNPVVDDMLDGDEFEGDDVDADFGRCRCMQQYYT